MYVVTFYSFKGGVGRTLALANVAIELARTGRRVLLVDFDLEAPGIDTFELMQPRAPHAGIVEYVSDYLGAGQAPDVRDYLYECVGVGGQKGRLWVMPAGKGQAEYSRALQAIDWKCLYRERDGFLMIEDLKAQWSAACQPDYVLIDSRTGHTDVGGICTRQLPDAVVVLFFPNEQNLAGLNLVVSSIRHDESRKDHPIVLHFVMSNVPDLDDEDEILANLSSRFRKNLGYESLGIIHRYDSLSLLEQSVFVATHPKTRLAREYRELVARIAEANASDRQGAMDFLSRILRPPRLRQLKEEGLLKRLEMIVEQHSNDPELMFSVAMAFRRQGFLDRMRVLIDRAISLGLDEPAAFLERAQGRLQEGNAEAAADDIMRAFHSRTVASGEMNLGVELLQDCASKKLLEVAKTPAFQELSIDRCLELAVGLQRTKDGLQLISDLLCNHRSRSDLTVVQSSMIRHCLLCAYIGLSRFSDALQVYGHSRPSPTDLTVDEAFNYGMAEWGHTHVPPKDMFARVLEDVPDKRSSTNANYCQCMAVALWACSRSEEALTYVSKADELICEKTTRSDFSCWRYLFASVKDFSDDCASIRQLILGESVQPLMFSGSASESAQNPGLPA